jgi:two-component system phosphate regulon response regulator PhoB|tara:strand:+ start:1101 stop:1808 length:708 start_codon:yes stop_codon:yes gene_type:complete
MVHKKKHILIIEDEEDIAELLEYNLQRDGFKTVVANNGETGLKLARQDYPDCILLDLMLPGIDGLDVCRSIKSDKDIKDVSIVMLTALGQEEDIIKGLESGADDYITKPFNFKVLKARIKSVLRRGTRLDDENQNDINILGVKIISRNREVFIKNTLIELTFTEYQILYLLASHPGWVFTRYQIIDKIRGDNYPVTDRSIDFQIVGLRKKMGGLGSLVQTIRGVGYRFQSNELSE